MKSLLILSSGSFWSERLAMHAKMSGYKVLILTLSQAYRASWHVTIKPRKTIEIKTGKNIYSLDACDLYYDEVSWSIAPSVMDLYQDGSRYHQHAWQAFFIGLYNVLTPVISYQPKHWSSYFWLWPAMMVAARSVDLKTIDEHASFESLNISKTWIESHFWILNLNHSGVIVRVMKTGDYWSAEKLGASWQVIDLPSSVKSCLNDMANNLSLSACEWIVLCDVDWYVCGCYRWQSKNLCDQNITKILSRKFCEIKSERWPSGISKDYRPDFFPADLGSRARSG